MRGVGRPLNSQTCPRIRRVNPAAMAPAWLHRKITREACEGGDSLLALSPVCPILALVPWHICCVVFFSLCELGRGRATTNRQRQCRSLIDKDRAELGSRWSVTISHVTRHSLHICRAFSIPSILRADDQGWPRRRQVSCAHSRQQAR